MSPETLIWVWFAAGIGLGFTLGNAGFRLWLACLPSHRRFAESELVGLETVQRYVRALDRERAQWQDRAQRLEAELEQLKAQQQGPYR